ncbi:hypothetical protein EON65_07020 [archaeon]|nr:MAG: hypothetical protein EON65_07020 [archaeon]
MMQHAQPNTVKESSLQLLLLHACSCMSEACTDPSCHNMKQLKQHIVDCKAAGCVICRDMSQLIHSHSSTCTRDACPVPSCSLYR